ncbi:cysteine protease [Thioploca ingrica]|uniref:Cysteine protease n=1 Tax=Thioploca ingrica TaxID=40754 RepID=A0A090AHV1_9GAMM|nr:cysteine protease [Thioploca ingrica]
MMKLPLIRFIILILTILSINAAAEKQHSTGLIFNDTVYNQIPLQATLTRGLYDHLPAQASLKKYSPLPKSQGEYRTCVGWATAYAARTILEAQQNGWTEKSIITQNAFAPGFIYNLIKADDDFACSRGSSISDALDIMVQQGVPKYSYFNKSCPETIPTRVYTQASPFRIKGYHRIFKLTDPNNLKIKTVKKSLAEGKPVVIGMNIPDSFDEPDEELWQPSESPKENYSGHAMTVIGYDDNRYGGAVELQNSWGIDWGNEGYIWIKYQDFAQFTPYAFELIGQFKKPSSNTPDLSGKLRLVLAASGEMPAALVRQTYKIQRLYPSGTRFRLYISNQEPAYVYAFGYDPSTGKTTPIFPYQPGISPALIYQNNEVAYPDEDHYVAMQGDGTDFLCALYSKNALDIEAIRQQIEQTNGSFIEKVRRVLSNKLVAVENIKFATAEIGFSAVSHDKTVVALIVEMEHTK